MCYSLWNLFSSSSYYYFYTLWCVPVVGVPISIVVSIQCNCVWHTNCSYSCSCLREFLLLRDSFYPSTVVCMEIVFQCLCYWTMMLYVFFLSYLPSYLNKSIVVVLANFDLCARGKYTCCCEETKKVYEKPTKPLQTYIHTTHQSWTVHNQINGVVRLEFFFFSMLLIIHLFFLNCE